jgi:hypothetical protein
MRDHPVKPSEVPDKATFSARFDIITPISEVANINIGLSRAVCNRTVGLANNIDKNHAQTFAQHEILPEHDLFPFEYLEIAPRRLRRALGHESTDMGMSVGKIDARRHRQGGRAIQALNFGIWEQIWVLVNPPAELQAIIEPMREHNFHFQFLLQSLLAFFLHSMIHEKVIAPMANAIRTLSILSATMCVVNLVSWFINWPPIATMPPHIASLSPTGSSAVVAITLEKKNRGSGVKGRRGASRFFAALA